METLQTSAVEIEHEGRRFRRSMQSGLSRGMADHMVLRWTQLGVSALARESGNSWDVYIDPEARILPPATP